MEKLQDGIRSMVQQVAASCDPQPLLLEPKLKMTIVIGMNDYREAASPIGRHVGRSSSHCGGELQYAEAMAVASVYSGLVGLITRPPQGW